MCATKGRTKFFENYVCPGECVMVIYDSACSCLANQACRYAGQAWDGNGPAASFFCESLQGKSLRASLGLLREHVPTCWREMSARLQSPVGAGTAGITLFGHVRLHLLALLYDLGSRAVQD